VLLACQVIILFYLLFTTIKIVEYIVDPKDFYIKPYDSLKYFVKCCILGYVGWFTGMIVPVIIVALINLFIKEQLQDKYDKL